MALFDERFDGWQAADFDAYLQKKWASNRFNLERGRVRLRLIDLLGQLADRAGIENAQATVWTSPDHPKLSNGHRVRGQAAAFTHDGPTRTAIERTDPAVDADDVTRKHAHIGLVIDATELVASLSLPAGARFDRTTWTGVKEQWAALAEGLEVALLDDELGVRVERRFARDDVLAGGADVEKLSGWLKAAWPILQATLWSESNDPAGLSAAVDAARAKAEEKAPEPAPEPEKSVEIAPAGSKTPEPKPPPRPSYPRGRTRQTGPYRPFSAASARAESKTAEGRREQRTGGEGRRGPRAGGDRKGGDRKGGDRKGGDTKRGDRRGGDTKRGDKSRRDRTSDGRRPDRPRRDKRSRDRGPRGPYELGPERGKKAPAAEIAPGATVVLKAGLFAGKTGEVVAVKKGKADVVVGGMTMSIAVKDLTLG